jgi:DNA-directed RNA polymerase specialized sigma24 family protein
MDLADVIALEMGLQELAVLDARQARVLELRFYGDLPVGEISAIVGVSKRTVEGDLTHGRAWLRRRLASKEEL